MNPKESLNDWIVCESGFTLSIQAHDGAYSEPRQSGARYYSSFEIGYPYWLDDPYLRTALSEVFPGRRRYCIDWAAHPKHNEPWMRKLMEYEEGAGCRDPGAPEPDPRKNIFCWVPVELVGEIIAANGGVKYGEMPAFDPEKAPLLAESMELIEDLPVAEDGDRGYFYHAKGYIYRKPNPDKSYADYTQAHSKVHTKEGRVRYD